MTERVPRSPPVSRAISVPSGDHAYPPTSEPVCVSCLTSLPSGFITKSSDEPGPLPDRPPLVTGPGYGVPVRRNVISEPSGDHSGCVACAPEVSCATSEPSAFITKICVPPPTWPTKAIFDPSGDHAGIVPVVLVSCVKPEPSVPMTAMTDGHIVSEY